MVENRSGQHEGAGSFDLLNGITVLDLTTSIAGPYATMLLSDFGAEIIKAERPGGDDARQWGPPFLDEESLWFLSVNRNKRSICIEGSSDAGRGILSELLDRVDVVITNQLPESQGKLGIDPETVRAGRPGLVHVSLTGFGLTGPRSSDACYDLIAEGYSGVMDLTGTADGPPQKIGTPAADLLAGGDAAMAVIAALFKRSTTGLGCSIDVSLAESMIRFLAPRIVPFIGTGEVPRRSGGNDSVIAIYQAFETADRPLTLALGSNPIWERFWVAVGRPEHANREGMETNVSRRLNRGAIVSDIQEILLTRGREDWLKRFRLAKVPAGPINRIDEVVADGALQERGIFFDIQRNGFALPQVGLGIRIDGNAAGHDRPPPRLGEHTVEVLAEILGYPQQRIDELAVAGAIKINIPCPIDDRDLKEHKK